MDIKFVKKAEDEIREDSTRKAQALAQFKDWISKHRFIKKCRQGLLCNYKLITPTINHATNNHYSTDDLFLLQFLRTKKYFMDQAFQVLENHLIFRQTHSSWFDMTDARVDKMKDFFRSGYVYPLMKRDADGRRIVLINQMRHDYDKFTGDDAIHLVFTVCFTLMQEEETQISGISLIINYEEVSIKYLSVYSVTDVVELVKFLRNSCPGRTKAFYLINLPTFAFFLINAAKAAMTEKLRSRLMIVKSWDDIASFVDKSLLPKELGGEQHSEIEMMASFMKIFDTNLTLLKETNEFEIDLNKLSNSGSQEGTGSFRKLEID